MDSYLQRIFLRQIWTQCQFVLIAYGDLLNRIADMPAADVRTAERLREVTKLPLTREESIAYCTEIALIEGIRTWFPIQALLTAAANMSKALWGQDSSCASEREPLRAALGIDESSPLRSRLVRNRFEHYDEKVDEWWKSSPSRTQVDLSFGDWAAASNIPDDHVFRTFDPATGDVVFWGERYNLGDVVAEVQRIMPLAIRGAAS